MGFEGFRKKKEVCVVLAKLRGTAHARSIAPGLWVRVHYAGTIWSQWAVAHTVCAA